MRRYTLVRLLALILLGYGIYTVWLVFTYSSVWFLLWAVPCLVGGVGLASLRTWSQYLFYFVAFCTVAGWAGFVAISWPHLAAETTTKLFALGLGLILFSIWSSVVVFRYFKRHDAQI
jgi:hypothetical protein